MSAGECNLPKNVGAERQFQAKGAALRAGMGASVQSFQSGKGNVQMPRVCQSRVQNARKAIRLAKHRFCRIFKP
jgi:hypothetical protein